MANGHTPTRLILHPRPVTTRYNRVVLYGIGGAAALVIVVYTTVLTSRRPVPQWERPTHLVSTNRPLVVQAEKPPPPPPPTHVLSDPLPQPYSPPPRTTAPPRTENPDVARRKAALLKARTAKVLVEEFGEHTHGQPRSTPVALQPEGNSQQTLEIPPVWQNGQPEALRQPAWNAGPLRQEERLLVGRQRRFWQQASEATTNQWLAASVQPPPSPYQVQAGTIIPVVLAQSILSDLEGQVGAVVSHDVYDSVSGQFLLIPQGSRLFGLYDADLQANQPRLHLAFKTLYFPNGYSLALQGMPGVDGRGQAGLSDQVNRHFFQRYGTAAVLSLVTAGIALATYNRSGFYTYEPQDAAVYGMGRVLGQAVAEDLRRAMQIRPTVTIREAYPFNVTISQDVVFPGPYPFITLAHNDAREHSSWSAGSQRPQ